VPALVTELLAALSASPAAVVAQLPFWAPLAAEIARRTGALLVYDRIDLHTAFPGVPAAVGEVERELMAGCDLVTASSEALASEPRRLGVPVRVLPNAVVPEDFPAAEGAHRAQVPTAVRRAQGTPTAPSAGDRPVAGMVGALDGRVDAEALAAAARALPGWELRLAGGVEDERVGELARLPNVSLAGEIPHHRVPAFLAALDVGLVPYRDLPWTRAIDPVKLYEMLAAGRPVVARRLPAVERWAPPMVYLYDRPEELPGAIAAAHQEDGDEPRRRRREAAGEESWRRRAAELLAALTAAAR
jgi:glycosyltransferase involved in cell wall biosynthesis